MSNGCLFFFSNEFSKRDTYHTRSTYSNFQCHYYILCDTICAALSNLVFLLQLSSVSRLVIIFSSRLDCLHTLSLGVRVNLTFNDMFNLQILFIFDCHEFRHTNLISIDTRASMLFTFLSVFQ